MDHSSWARFARHHVPVVSPFSTRNWVWSHASGLQQQRIEFALGLAHGLHSRSRMLQVSGAQARAPNSKACSGRTRTGHFALQNLHQNSFAAWAAGDAQSASARHQELLVPTARFGVLAISSPSGTPIRQMVSGGCQLGGGGGCPKTVP